MIAEWKSHPTLLAWQYGSGFPRSKSLDVSKAIDKASGAEREIVATSKSPFRMADPKIGNVYESTQTGDTREVDEDGYIVRETTAPATEDAARWEGWGTALKPAFEPIVMARKPLVGTVVANVLEHGTGALNIDACRIAVAGDRELYERNHSGDRGHAGTRELEERGVTDLRPGGGSSSVVGRWPANVMLVHHEDCEFVGTARVPGHAGYPNGPGGKSMHYASSARSSEVRPDAWRGHADADGMETVEEWRCVDGCPVAALDRQAGRAGAAAPVRGTEPSSPTNGIYGEFAGRVPGSFFDDVGGPSRFFYCAKASRSERNAGLEDFEAKEVLWSNGTQNPGSFQSAGTERAQQNDHPTVKPVDVMRWLVRLVTPPGGLVLDPFAGSGTTGIACALEGMRFVGVEQDERYVAIARARIRFWAEHGEDALRIVAERDAALRRRRQSEDAGQLSLM